MGDISYLDTHVTVTSAMDITNIGTGPALIVTQTGQQSVAVFYDEIGHPALYIEGTASKPGWVGIGNNNPNVSLAVTGSISATDCLYVQGDTTFYGYLSANTSIFTPVLSTQDIKAYGGNGVNIETTQDTLIAKFGNDGNTTFYGYLSANTSIFTPVLSTQDIKAYGGNGVNIETTSDVKVVTFGNDGNTTIYGNVSAGNSFLQSLSLPVSSCVANNIVLDFSKNSYVICPIYTTTNISFSSIAPGKTMKAILSSIVATPQTLNLDNRFVYVGVGRPITLAAGKVGYLQAESFGTTVSSVIINYFAHN